MLFNRNKQFLMRKPQGIYNIVCVETSETSESELLNALQQQRNALSVPRKYVSFLAVWKICEQRNVVCCAQAIVSNWNGFHGTQAVQARALQKER